jgi:leucyl aminopeptidase
MQIVASFAPPAEIQADWLIAGAWEDAPPGEVSLALDKRLGGVIERLRQSGDLTGKAKEVTTLLDCQGLLAPRLLIVGLGQRAQFEHANLHDAAALAARSITVRSLDRLAMIVPTDVPGLGLDEIAIACGAGLWHGCEGPGLRKSKLDRFTPKEIVLAFPPGASENVVRSGVERALAVGEAVSLARELVNTPPCDLYPETFASRAEELAGATGIECSVLNERRLEAERMGALLAVARGSDRPPRLVALRYRGASNDKWLALVGKGVTFDSGGLSLKTTEQMVDMKCDMAGAATVLAAMGAIARLKLPVNVLGILALVENMPGGRSMKLGDVLHARNGKTIEVLNTDAEGRLILADALAYAVDLQASHIVDLATLTGACMVALGTEVAGVMGNNDAWRDKVLEAARRAGERAWPLPMFPMYADMIKSDVADIKNTGGVRWAGAISAAKFLEEFVGPVPWTHLDIAGPAWAERESPIRASGGTGCYVRTLVELARDYS